MFAILRCALMATTINKYTTSLEISELQINLIVFHSLPFFSDDLNDILS